jgi:hypothetical protein
MYDIPSITAKFNQGQAFYHAICNKINRVLIVDPIPKCVLTTNEIASTLLFWCVRIKGNFATTGPLVSLDLLAI